MSVNHIFDLPADVLVNIFKRLSLIDLRNVMLTCRQMREFVIQSSPIWRHLTRNKLVIENKKIDRYKKYLLYDAARISYNWRNGIFNEKQILKFRKKYMPWIKYCPEVLLVSVASELKSYHVNQDGNPKCSRTLWTLTVPKTRTGDIRTNDISRFVYKDSLIACAHRDGSANLYKVDDERKQPRLIQNIPKCHNNGVVEVSCVDVMNRGGRSFMVTGSDRSQQIVFWTWPKYDGTSDTQNQKVVRSNKEVTLREYQGARCLAMNNVGDCIAIGPESGDKPVFLDVNTMTVLPPATPQMRHEVVRDITWHDQNTVAYVNHHARVALMDVRSQQIIFDKLDPFHTALYCVKTDGNNALVVGSAQYARCVLYDRRMNHYLQMYFTQKERSPVYSLDFNRLKLLAAIDRSIGVVDFNTYVNSGKHRDFSNHIFDSEKLP